MISCNCKKKGCKPCKSVYNKVHYQNNKQLYINKAKLHNVSYMKRNRQFVYDYLLKHPCVDCGETNPIKLEFDHMRDKEYLVSVLIRQGVSLNKLKKEIAKCSVRCASCHREKTAKELGHWIYKKYYGSLA